MKKTFSLFAFACAFSFLSAQSAASFINEVNYLASNPTGRGMEIAGTAGTSLNGWSAVIYNLNGTVRSVEDLSNQVIPNQQNGYGTIWYDVDQMSNGGGIALINPTGIVEQFLSYGGTPFVNYVVNATQGPAAGMVSQAIGKQELPVASLQLTGIGLHYANFVWALPLGVSPGGVNLNQTFGLLPQLAAGNTSNESGFAGMGQAPDYTNDLVQAVEITAFPLPVYDKLQVRLRNAVPQPVHIRLFNFSGQLLETMALESHTVEAELSLGNLPAGQYMLHVEGAPPVMVPRG